MNNWMDFNDAQEPSTLDELASKDIKQRILDRLPDFLRYLYPNGKMKGQKLVLGNVAGDKGKSLEVEL